MDKKWAVFAAFLALNGCDGKSPAGAGASSETTSGVKSGASLSGEKSLERDKRNIATMETPLLPVIFEALGDLQPVIGPLPESDIKAHIVQEICAFAQDHANDNRLDKFIEQTGLEGVTPEERADVLAEISPKKYDNPMIFAVIATPQEAKRACIAIRAYYIGLPSTGWPAHPKSAGAANYMIGTLSGSISLAELFVPIAQKMAKNPGKTRDEYKHMVLEEIDARAASYFQQHKQRGDSLRNGNTRFTADMSSSQPAPVHYTTNDGYDVQVGPGGVLLTYQGIEWFGKGYIHGTRYSLTVADATAATLSRSSSVEGTRNTGTGIGISGEVRTQ